MLKLKSNSIFNWIGVLKSLLNLLNGNDCNSDDYEEYVVA